MRTTLRNTRLNSRRGIRVLSIGATAACLALALGACKSKSPYPPTVKPASPSPGLSGERATTRELSTTVDGVKVTTRGDTWPGDAVIREEVTPLHIKLENDSGRPLRVEYKRFVLVDESGKQYTALPPYEIGGTAKKPVKVTVYRPFADPYFGYQGFYIYPYYSSLYPGATIWSAPPTYGYDIDYYRDTYTYWKKIGLPTPEMLRRALVEGVLEPGGSMSGFLYFPEIPKQTENVRLQVRLIDANTDRTFATVTMPMKTRGEGLALAQ